MTLLSVLLIAVGLSMDAFAVAITCGLGAKPLRWSYALRIAVFFGTFQAVMPVLGWLAGGSLQTFIISFDHWIAFVLLAAIGCKMIYESIQPDGKLDARVGLSLLRLLALSLATSIDALAVGVSFAFLKTMIFGPAIVIGLVTFVICYAGVWIGNRFGHFCEKKFELAGGLILLGIGVKIIVSHLGE